MKTRIIVLLFGLLISLLVINCACPDDDCKSCPQNPPTQTNNQAYLSIINSNPQFHLVHVGAKNFFWQEGLILTSYGYEANPASQETVIITAISFEDTYSGTNNLNEINNLRLFIQIANGYCPPADALNDVSGIINLPVEPSPQHANISLTEPVILEPGDCARIRIVGDLSETADTTTPGSHDMEFTDVTAFGVESLETLTEDNQHLFIHHQHERVTNVPADPGHLSIQPDLSEPYENIILDSSTLQSVAIFRVNAYGYEDINLQSLKLTDLGNGKAASTCYLFSNSRNDGQSVSQPIASAAMSATDPAFCELSFDAVTVSAGSSVLLTVKADFNNINDFNLYDDDLFQLAVSNPMTDLTGIGLITNQVIHGQPESQQATENYIFQSRPYVSLSPESPSGLFVPSAMTLIGIFKISAAPGGNISFIDSFLNGMSFDITTSCDTIHNSYIYLKDGYSNLLDSGQVYTCDQNAIAGITFVPNNFTIVASTSQKIYVYLDTTQFTGPNNVIQIGMRTVHSWGINNFGGYGHTHVIIPGGIYAPILVKP